MSFSGLSPNGGGVKAADAPWLAVIIAVGLQLQLEVRLSVVFAVCSGGLSGCRERRFIVCCGGRGSGSGGGGGGA